MGWPDDRPGRYAAPSRHTRYPPEMVMQPVYILYGTETYNSEDLAQRTGEAIEEKGKEMKKFLYVPGRLVTIAAKG